LYLFRRQLQARGVEIRTVEKSSGKVLIFVDEFERIFANLIANAIDALPGVGGKLHIEIGDGQAEGAAQLLIAVGDNGSGIDPDHAARIFEPFYTTKTGIGTGIGLWVTKELVEKNGGTISFVSGLLDEGMKTRFEMRFPKVTGIG
jgi:signal transduction histidine kinase